MSFKKTCKVCGRVFYSAKYSSKYCSQNCYVKSRNWASQTKHVLESQGDKRHLNDILYNKVCPQCNASFTAKKTNTIFCSQRCGKLYRKTQKDLKEGLKITGLSAVNAAVNNAGSDKKYKILKSCANCGAQFHAMKVTTMFCSSACARKFRRGQNSKERAEKITEDTIRKRVEMRDLASPEAEYLRPEEAARYLGIGLRTLYRYMSDGLISSKQLPGVTVISRSALRAILADDVSLRVRTKASIEVASEKHNDVLNGDYMTIPEAAGEYGVKLGVMQHYLRSSDLKFIMYRNTRFYKRTEVDRLVRRRIKESHPEITQWYSVEDILNKFKLPKSRFEWHIYKHPIPKRKEGGYTYYSKTHVDQVFGYLLEQDKYYSTDDILEKYGIDKRKTAKLVQRFDLPKISAGGRILIEKEPFDAFMKLNS